ncbi:MAG TPA: helix-turn-helix transcriptional regulator [bacterium]|jgi:transcriptional regulator with XRE-family HTH domain
MPLSSLAPLLDEILRAAKAQGLDQKSLAARAGLSAPTLSRMKSQDDVALSTLVRLAAVVGLRLALVAADDFVAEVERGELF